jgi:riboflavin synthase
VFTGIVKERGQVRSFDGGRLLVESSIVAAIGDSVAVDGVCLTVVEAKNGTLAFDVVGETSSRVKPFGAEANLEPALRAGEPLGGHLVQGHVDGIGEVVSVAEDGIARRVSVQLVGGLDRYVVEHGSVTVAGVSLTVAGLGADRFEVSLIPETLERTTLGSVAQGSRLNIELDVVARYVERLLGFSKEGES